MGTSRSDGAERFTRWVVLAAAAVVPCIFVPWLRDRFVIPRLAAAGAASLLGTAGLLACRRLRGVSSDVDAPLAVFCAAAAAASAASIDPWLSWFGYEGNYLLEMSGIAACTAAFYLGCAMRRMDGEPWLSSSARWVCAASIPVSLYALVQWLGFEPFWFGAGIDYRAASSFGNASQLGVYLAVVLPPAAALYLDGEGRADRLIGAAACAAALPALALSGSRGAWLAAAAGLGVYGLIRSRAGGGRRPASNIRRSPVLLAALAAAVLLFAGTVLLRLQPRNAGSDPARLRAWVESLRIFSEQPVLGSGPGTFMIGFRMRKDASNASDFMATAHNDWLTLLATTGLLGVLAYAWLHVAGWKAFAARSKEGGGAAAAFCGAAAAVFVQSKFSPTSIGVAWLAALLAGSVLCRPSPAKRYFRAAPALLVIAALWSCFTGARAWAADRQALLGRRARGSGDLEAAALRFEAAVRERPESLAYRYDFINLLWQAARTVEDVPVRSVLLMRASGVALEGLRCRPLEADLYRLLGLSELRRYQWGGEDRLTAARSALEASLRLDPYYDHTLQDLAETAGLQGDEETEHRMRRRLERIRQNRRTYIPRKRG